MAMSLPAPLLAAQNAPVRHPAVELQATQFEESIPFKGNRIDELFKDECGLTTVLHSSGRVCVAYLFRNQDNHWMLQYVYSNEERTEFNYVELWREYYDVSDLALAELKDGNIALLVMYGDRNMKAHIMSVKGIMVSSSEIAGTVGCYGAGILSRDKDYLIMFSKPAPAIVPVISGKYTSTETKDYTLVVTKDGDYTNSAFKYGNLQQDVSMAGGTVIQIENGLSVSFPKAYYFKGQEFYFTAYKATYSSCQLSINDFPKDGATVTVAGTAYTFRDVLTLVPDDPNDLQHTAYHQIPYEVKIDHLSKEITLENLNCAINHGSYDASGEGERYAIGTPTNPLVQSSRSRGSNSLYLSAKNLGDLRYPVELGAGCGIGFYYNGVSGLNGGKESSYTVVTTLPSCKTCIVTSDKFTKWSKPLEYILQGIVPIRDKRRYYFNKLKNGNILLWFDCITAGRNDITAVYNIFYSMSSDGGLQWTKAKTVTDYNTPQVIARNARCAEQDAGRLMLAYQETHGCMCIDHHSQGVPENVMEELGGLIMNVDFECRRAYVSSTYQYDMFNVADATNYILEIDIDEWRVLRHWNDSTAPALPHIVSGVHYEESGGPFHVHDFDQTSLSVSKGRYNIIVQPTACHIMVMDVITNRIVDLQFANWQSISNAHFRLNNNTDISGSSISGDHHPLGAWVDDGHDRLWVVFSGGKQQEFAYLDLKQVFDFNINRYDVNVVTKLYSGANGEPSNDDLRYLDYNQVENIWTFSWMNGVIQVTDGESWGTLYRIYPNNCGGYPVDGISGATYREGKIYGGACNDKNEAQYNGIQGLCIIDLQEKRCSYYVPPFILPDCYDNLSILRVCVTKSNKVIFAATGNGVTSVCVYHLDTQKWTVINSSTVSGFKDPETLADVSMHVAYDESNGNIYVMQRNSWQSNGIQVVNIDGKVERIAYRNVTVDAENSVISIGEPKLLVKGNAEANSHLFYAPDGLLYTFWQKRQSGYRKVFWDKESGIMDLSPYLLRGAEVVVTKTLDGTPSSLNFELANGHLFDPTNTRSMLSSYFRKGKKITLRVGEKINGITIYPNNPDVFIVVGSSLSLKRGQYPTIKVEGKDRRTIFEELKITATPYYAATAPHTVLSGILQEYGGYQMGHLDLEVFDEKGAAIKGQFIDKTVQEIIDDIGSRFGYFPVILPGDIFSMKKIDLAASPVHIYSGATWLVDYTPDDSFSDMTNKITVIGESPDKTSVIMPEELVLQDSGTVGWYKRKKTKRLYYSADGTKTYLYPRLVKVESATAAAFKLAGTVKEYIASVDHTNNEYVEIAIEAPDLTGVFCSALSMILLAKAFPPTLAGGQSKPAAILECMGTWLAFQCVGAVANYQFEIYAQPVGYVRQSFEYSVTDDELLKTLNGTVVEKKIDDALCYTVEHCKKVAEFELKIAKAQRNRVKMTKIAHLQDEIGDVIAIHHPYNQLQQRIFITDITRRILIPQAGSTEGHVLDEIEGWKL